MASLQFYAPAAPSRTAEQPLAARAPELNGKTVALLDNQKANAGRLLAQVGIELARRAPDVEVVTEKKIATSPSPPEVMDRLRTVDAVVLAIAD